MSSLAKIIAIVPVRGGSKGLPGKNVRLLAGEPLYLRAVKQALRLADYCVISTDIPEILQMRAPERTQLLERPPELSKDQTVMVDVVADVIDRLNLKDETLLLLQATSPLRSDEDIRTVLRLHATGGYDTVLTVTQAESEVLKYGTLEDGEYRPLSDPLLCFDNRQNLPNVYRHNGAAYAFNAQMFRASLGFPHEKIGAVVMPADRSYDIDTQADFDAAAQYLAS